MKLLASLLALWPLLAPAQATEPDRTGGYAYNSAYNKLYHPETVITFSGRITGISVSPPMRNMDAAVTILVRSPNGGTSIVELGPAWYIDRQQVKFEIKDQVEVTGSKVLENGRGVIFAARVVTGGTVLNLRDNKGLPVWDSMRPKTQVLGPDTRAFTGQVVSLSPGEENQPGAMTVDTGAGNVLVQTPPTWYMSHQNFTYLVGESLIFYAGPDLHVSPGVTVITNAISAGDNLLIMRSSGGRPMWQSWSPISGG